MKATWSEIDLETSILDHIRRQRMKATSRPQGGVVQRPRMAVLEQAKPLRDESAACFFPLNRTQAAR